MNAILEQIERELLALADDTDDDFVDGYAITRRIHDIARKIGVEVERQKLKQVPR